MVRCAMMLARGTHTNLSILYPGGYNIYSKPLEGQDTCIPIWLVADNCLPPPPPAPPAQSPPSSPVPAPPAAPPQVCPAQLTGDWQFPHLIIPLDASHPNMPHKTQYNSTVGGQWSTIFNFDIPMSYAGKQCTLEFLFPTQDQLETSGKLIDKHGLPLGDGELTASFLAFEYTPGKFQFAFLGGVATEQTSYANAPKVTYNFGEFQLKPGTATTIGSCPHGA